MTKNLFMFMPQYSLKFYHGIWNLDTDYLRLELFRYSYIDVYDRNLA